MVFGLNSAVTVKLLNLTVYYIVRVMPGSETFETVEQWGNLSIVFELNIPSLWLAHGGGKVWYMAPNSEFRR